VQINSDPEVIGKWVDENCMKKYAVVCQKVQKISVSRLHELFLNLEKSFVNLKKNVINSVPIGFIYVQLPNQLEPKTLWPTMEWKNVGSDYSGHFFRVEGGNAAQFGQSQMDAFQGHEHSGLHTPDKYGYQFYNIGDKNTDSYTFLTSINNPIKHIIVSNDVNGNPRNASETRPINYSVRVWKRVN